MFTGLLPSQHGILGHSWHIRHSLRKNIPTLSQVLTDNGYNTYAEFTGPLTPESGINRGLKHFRWRGRADYLHKGCNDYLADFFPKLKPPWFLCLHVWEAHYPYQDPKPFNRKSFGLTRYDRALSLLDFSLQELSRLWDSENTAVIYTSDHGERLKYDCHLNKTLGGNEFEIVNLYKKFTKRNKSLINFLRPRRIKTFDLEGWINTLRETFDETTARIYAHKVLGHGFHLTEELIRIPLVIYDPENCQAGKVDPSLRTQTDLPSTVLDIAGIEGSEKIFPMSRSLFKSSGHDMIYIEANGCGGIDLKSPGYLRGAKSKRWKYWRIEPGDLQHKVLWDLKNDPREIKNVILDNPDIAEKMDMFVSRRLDSGYLPDIKNIDAM